MQILIAVTALGAIGLALGLLLAGASKYLAVPRDARVPSITEALPGANCGGCGFAGCGALASAIAEGKAAVTACPVGGERVSAKIAEIMGVEASPAQRTAALVLCSGVDGAAKKKYQYEGAADCAAVSRLAGGDKSCRYGCLGYGDCVRACQFGAIRVTDGVARVDREKCTACGMCAAACPKGVIRLIPADKSYSVSCSSRDKGSAMKNLCGAGCIACRLCERACPAGAVTVTDNIAEIDYAKCTDCGECFRKCPRKIIRKSAESE
ncbi:MAG: Fe-S cluster domain-containing protein [Clostridiales bacterium]|jgi:Na+-translocating ferredoxin:NAD+ oxidoreductase RNF subunit RnfB|nr:Fe-S cluster domain-containing protein [Clostridiales bacterium]